MAKATGIGQFWLKTVIRVSRPHHDQLHSLSEFDVVRQESDAVVFVRTSKGFLRDDLSLVIEWSSIAQEYGIADADWTILWDESDYITAG